MKMINEMTIQRKRKLKIKHKRKTKNQRIQGTQTKNESIEKVQKHPKIRNDITAEVAKVIVKDVHLKARIRLKAEMIEVTNRVIKRKRERRKSKKSKSILVNIVALKK